MCTIVAHQQRRMMVCDSAEELSRVASRNSLRSPPRKLGLVASSPRPSARRRLIAASSSAGGLQRPGQGSLVASWPKLTQQLVASSTLPFLLLLWPQLLKNARNLVVSPESLGILSWLSFLTGLFGNTLLLQYFTSKREMSAVLVQAIGIASSFAVLTQIRIAGFMPRLVYSGVAAIVACTATLTALKLGGRLDGSKEGQRVWGAWQKVLGLAGLAVVPQVLWSTFVGTPNLLPSLCTLALGCSALALDSAGRLPPAVANAWGGLSAWTATLLFMVQPVSQLFRNFQDPSSLAGLSLATIQLAACGNALMVPRALFTRDTTWLVGSLWGSLVFGWAQMLSMWVGTCPHSGARYLGTPLFMASSLLLLGWFAGVVWVDARAKRALQPEGHA